MTLDNRNKSEGARGEPSDRPAVGPHDGASCVAAETLSPEPVDFLRRWVYDNPALADRRELFTRWFADPTPREDIAAALEIPLGVLLRSFNHTAPLAEPIGFRYRGVPFTVTGMAGVCDDLAEGRFPQFGAPVTLRCHLADTTLLPQEMFEAADWNFMDAGRPGFVGYLYGVRHDHTLYLAGVQSDLAVRYSYLFQGRDGGSEVRVGDVVVAQDPATLTARYGPYVPTLRRTIQRYWIAILLGAAAAWATAEPHLDEVGLLRFPLRPEEDAPGHVVHRVYRELPERLGARTRCVRVADECHLYSVSTVAEITRYLGDRWQPENRPHRGSGHRLRGDEVGDQRRRDAEPVDEQPVCHP